MGRLPPAGALGQTCFSLPPPPPRDRPPWLGASHLGRAPGRGRLLLRVAVERSRLPEQLQFALSIPLPSRWGDPLSPAALPVSQGASTGSPQFVFICKRSRTAETWGGGALDVLQWENVLGLQGVSRAPAFLLPDPTLPLVAAAPIIQGGAAGWQRSRGAASGVAASRWRPAHFSV